MRKIKNIIFLLFCVLIIVSTFASTCFLVFFSFLYLYYKVDVDINTLTVSFYLTFGLAVLTALLIGYAHTQEEKLNDALGFKKE